MNDVHEMPESLFPSAPALMALAASTSQEEFASRYSGHYLIATAVCVDDIAAHGFKTSAIATLRPGHNSAPIAVWPVAKRDQTNPYSWMITIGRTRNNDIVLPYVSISKLHAWIRRTGDDADANAHADAIRGFTITDAGSRNGTFVDGVPLHAETCELRPGTRLRLGQLELIFVDGRMLYQAMRRSRPSFADVPTRAAG